MGETTSTWKVPLHSSDSEHPWMKDRDSTGKGGAFRLNRSERPFIGTTGNPTSGLGTSDTKESTNPFGKR